MSEDITNQSGDSENNSQFLGGFKSVEELEAGYKALRTKMDQRANVQVELDSLKSSTVVPESYNIEGLEVEIDVSTDLQSKAKSLGLTQVQFDAFCQSNIDLKTKKQELLSEIENNKIKKYGEGVYEQTKKYISSEHKLSDATINNLSDVELDHFSNLHKKFNESPMHIGSTASVYKVTRSQVNEAREVYNNATQTMKDEAWTKYEALATAISENR